MRIGIFDSGIGGLTVLNKLVNKFPNNHYIYFGDTKNLPYGNKSLEELKELTDNIIKFLLKQNVDVIVIACGTISSNLTDYLTSKYNIKIIDVISPIIKYLNNCNYEKIGIIATFATINSKIFSKNINKNINKNIKEIACPKFVSLIENNDLNNIDYYIDLYLNDLRDRDIIVLGCTHYPIIKDKIQKYLGNKVKLLDMGEYINISSNEEEDLKIDLYFSYINDTIRCNIKQILDNKINSINLVK